MKYVTSFIGAAALAVASFGAQASPVTAGGITWDPLYNGGVAGRLDFQQWYTSPANYTVNSQGIKRLTNGNAVSVGTGLLSGVGLVRNLETGRSVTGNIFGNNSLFQYCELCRLTFSFGGLAATTPTTMNGQTFINFDTSASWLNIYVQDVAAGDSQAAELPSAAYNSVNSFQSGQLWASFTFDSFVLNSGDPRSGSVLSYLSFTGGNEDVLELLDFNNGVSDLLFTASSQFTGSSLYATSNGQFQSIPEPASLALLGLGLLGLAGRRFKKA
ncbi:MAG: PEP-CTERM sorting domain-containing protein [Alishewanella agri]|nr:PEP-CTERM sorting domain-containing protein [Alishewanella agri]